MFDGWRRQVFEATALFFSQTGLRSSFWFASRSLSSCLYFVLLSMSSGNFQVIYTGPIKYIYICANKYIYICKIKYFRIFTHGHPNIPHISMASIQPMCFFCSPSLPSRWKSEVVHPDRLGLRKNDEVLVSQGILVEVPSRELTYPTWGKGKSSSKCNFLGICIINVYIHKVVYIGGVTLDSHDVSFLMGFLVEVSPNFQFQISWGGWGKGDYQRSKWWDYFTL